MTKLHDIKFDKAVYSADDTIGLTAVYSDGEAVNYAVISYGSGDRSTKDYLFESMSVKHAIAVEGPDQICTFKCISGKQQHLTGQMTLNYALIVHKIGTADLFISPGLKVTPDDLKLHVNIEQAKLTVDQAQTLEDAPVFEVN